MSGPAVREKRPAAFWWLAALFALFVLFLYGPILTIVIQTPRDAERLRANPLGIYVNAINWSREMSQ